MDLPLPLLGIFRARILTMSDTSGQGVPWANEIQFENFSESIGIAPYSEVLLSDLTLCVKPASADITLRLGRGSTGTTGVWGAR